MGEQRLGIWPKYLLLLVLLALVIHIETLLLSGHWNWLSLLVHPKNRFAALEFELSALPRLVVTLLVGAAMGLSGAIMQLLTQNRLVSPMTIGASSGAWLGLLLITLLAPTFAAHHGEWGALIGALATVGLALWIAGRNGINGLPLVLSGMALNLLLGALATIVLLLNAQSTRGLFLWGAGDLTQIDWHWAAWLWPRLLPVGALLLMFARRPLTLLQLGSEGASGLGLNLWPTLLVLFMASLWLTASAVTAVGLIGFIGLVAPNLAHLTGARRVSEQLICSTLLGMLLLVSSDAIAVLAGDWLQEQIPSGATAALIGAPVLVWLSRRRLHVEDAAGLRMAVPPRRFGRRDGLLLAVIGAVVVAVSLCLTPSLEGWRWQWPAAVEWQLHWPRLLACLAAGSGLAVAGCMLQRLLHNPLASPDILGLTAGSILAVMLLLMVSGTGMFWIKAPVAAFVGALFVLGVLLAMGRRHHYSPNVMILVGIGLGALLNTLMQFILSKGSGDALVLLGWLAGSSYRVTGSLALRLSVEVVLLLVLCLCTQRALTLLDLGDQVAASRGLDVARARLVLLSLIALLCAMVTSLLGPIGFLGLLAPHMAFLLGARRVLAQMLLAAVFGALLMLFSDWLGQVLIFPREVPVGIVASVICGLYFVYLLLRYRAK